MTDKTITLSDEGAEIVWLALKETAGNINYFTEYRQKAQAIARQIEAAPAVDPGDEDAALINWWPFEPRSKHKPGSKDYAREIFRAGLRAGIARQNEGGAREIGMTAEVSRLRGQNARLLARLENAGLLGEPVDALNGMEQSSPDGGEKTNKP